MFESRYRRVVLAGSLLCALGAGCGGEIGPTKVNGGDFEGGILDERGCDPITPYDCGFPFPSDVYLVEDATMVTGHHVHVPNGVLVPYANNGAETDLSILHESDGFSASAQVVARLPGATTVGLPDSAHIADSLLQDSPTVILDTVTGERVAHWAELDQRSLRDGFPSFDTDEGRRAFLVRPASRLVSNRRYIVAIRDVVNSDGKLVDPSPVFAALRDRTPTKLGTVELRREKYADIFERLEDAGVDRSTLQLAWDFTTASTENDTRRLLYMRDQALAELGPSGSPAYTITSIVDDPPNDAHVKRIIRGTMTVPMYLSSTVTGGTMTIGADHLPVRQGSAEFPFTFVIPQSAVNGPVPLIQVGHGLFGEADDALDRRITQMIDARGAVVLAFDWLGLSHQDIDPLTELIFEGNLAALATIPDRGQQAVLNTIVGARMVTNGMVDDPATFLGGMPTIDPSEVVYLGISLGGIYGSTFMAVSPDVERGATGVAGMSFDLLLPRSQLFDPFLTGFSIMWDDHARFPLFLNVIQMAWDRVDPSGYAHHLRSDPLPGSFVKDVFMITARGDQYVCNAGNHLLARSVGLPLIEPIVAPVFGVPTIAGPTTGEGWIEMDFGLPAIPITNVPMRATPDVHGAPWGRPIVQSMIVEFLETGVIEHQCSGPCDPD